MVAVVLATDEAFLFGLSVEEVSTILQAVGAIGSLLVILVYIFQNQLLQDQAMAMKAGFLPVLEINQIDAGPPEEADSDIEDFLTFHLSNVGNAVAKDLELEACMYPVDPSWSDRLRERLPFFSGFPLAAAASPVRNTTRDVYESETRGAVLGANAKEEVCVGTIRLQRVDDSASTVRPLFSNALSDVQGDRVCLEMTLLYESAIGDRSRVPLSPAIEFDAHPDLSSFINVYEVAEENMRVDDLPNPPTVEGEPIHAVYCEHSEE